VFPPGLPIGTVSEASETRTVLQPVVDIARLSEARILDYGVEGILPPPEKVPAVEKTAPQAGPAK
jgi:cell shape-determining protein MreC